MFPRLWLFCKSYRFQDIGVQSHPWFQELPYILLFFGCCYSVGSLDIDFIFVSLVGLMEALHQQ